MSKHLAETARVSRNTWTIMAAGLWARVFKHTQEPSALTRWADLEEEIEGIHA